MTVTRSCEATRSVCATSVLTSKLTGKLPLYERSAASAAAAYSSRVAALADDATRAVASIAAATSGSSAAAAAAAAAANSATAFVSTSPSSRSAVTAAVRRSQQPFGGYIYFPVHDGSLVYCVEAFALDARNQIPVHAIGERTV